MAVHADAWVPGKTTLFDGYVALMIVVCHMTGFTAIEPIKQVNLFSFVLLMYIMLPQYGLLHISILITDPDSKFTKTSSKLLHCSKFISISAREDMVM
jgi:hypothetical protein